MIGSLLSEYETDCPSTFPSETLPLAGPIGVLTLFVTHVTVLFAYDPLKVPRLCAKLVANDPLQTWPPPDKFDTVTFQWPPMLMPPGAVELAHAASAIDAATHKTALLRIIAPWEKVASDTPP
jgi:hypothetical protein